MSDRNRFGRRDYRNDYDRGSYRNRQPEQFQTDRGYYDDGQNYSGQMGDDFSQARYGEQYEDGFRDERYGGSWGDESTSRAQGRSYGGGTGDDLSQRRYGNRERTGFNSFNAEDFRTAGSVGPRENLAYGRGDTNRSTAYSRGSYGPGTYGVAPRRDYTNNDIDERGFFDRAGDEVASWFGDEDAARRREMDHRGRGPANYTRSDERILEDACDRLTEDWGVDARNVQVTVQNGEITLDGTVENRRQKRRAEDVAHDLSGVSHVQNNLRIADANNRSEDVTYGENQERNTGALA